MKFIQNSILLILNSMSLFTHLPTTEIAIFSTLLRFEGCLEVEAWGWLKTGNKGHSFQALHSLKLLPTFLVVLLLIRDKVECHLIKVVTMHTWGYFWFWQRKWPNFASALCAIYPIDPLFNFFSFTSAICLSMRASVQNWRKIYYDLIFLPRPLEPI